MPIVDAVSLVTRPIMKLWRASRERTADDIPRPTDEPRAHSSGIDSDRVLLFGAGPAVGWGVLSHDLALPGSLARSLTQRTGRGTDIDLVADPALVAHAAIEALGPVKLWRYDAIVIVLGVNDALAMTSAARWCDDMSALLSHVTGAASRSTRVFVVGIQPIRSIDIYDSTLGGIADRHARVLNAASARLCARLPRVSFVPLPAPAQTPTDRHRDKTAYRDWASHLSGYIADELTAGREESTEWPSVGGGRSAHVAEAERQRAVDALGIDREEPDQRFDAIVHQAKALFGTESAVFSILDGDTQWYKARAGLAVSSTPRDGAFCDATIRSRGAFVVPDASVDPRFENSDVVVGEPHVRFYAGFPVEAPSGERIGALCVFDSQPRAYTDVDVRLLRELALLVQTQLHDVAAEQD